MDQAPPETQPAYAPFIAQAEALPQQIYTWANFNLPVIKRISQQLGCNLHFGLADQRYVAFELARLDQFAALEHSFLLQSNIIYDPQHFLTTIRQAISGTIYLRSVQLYTAQHLDRLSPRLFHFLVPQPDDQENLAWSGQIEWVNMAVRCVRNAVAAKSYCATGIMLYKKPDILHFYQQHLPADFALVEQLYAWKTDAPVRAEMARSFAANPALHFATFRALMPQLADLVAKVRDL